MFQWRLCKPGRGRGQTEVNLNDLDWTGCVGPSISVLFRPSVAGRNASEASSAPPPHPSFWLQGVGGLIGNCRPHCLQIDGVPDWHQVNTESCRTHIDCLPPIHALKLSQANQYFLNHHIHVWGRKYSWVCGTHLCAEVTLQPEWDHIQVEIRMRWCICSKIEHSLSHFGFLYGVHDKSRHPHVLGIPCMGKRGDEKDLNKDTVIIIDLRRALVTALQNSCTLTPPQAHSQIRKMSGETLPSTGGWFFLFYFFLNAASDCRNL